MNLSDTVISGVDENVPSIGAHAVETVVGMIHRNERGVPARPFSLLIEGVWTNGSTTSTRRVSAAKARPKTKR